MKTYNFKVVVERDEDFEGSPSGWHAYCPALQKAGGATWGETRAEALRNINEVVRMIVQEFVEEGRPLPEGPPTPSAWKKFPRSSLASPSPSEAWASITGHFAQ